MGSVDQVTALARRHGSVWLFAPRGDGSALAESLGLIAEPVALWRNREVTVLHPKK